MRESTQDASHSHFVIQSWKRYRIIFAALSLLDGSHEIQSTFKGRLYKGRNTKMWAHWGPSWRLPMTETHALTYICYPHVCEFQIYISNCLLDILLGCVMGILNLTWKNGAA